MTQMYSKIGFTISSALLTFCLGSLMILFGGLIDVGGGAGFDGIIYQEQVRNFEQLFAEKRLNSTDILPGQPAKVNRFLPSMIVHYGMKSFGIPFEPANIVKAFQYHNLIWLVLASLAWGGITFRLKLQEKSKWFGWVMFFCTWATLRMPFFDPVLTDTTALCLALIMLFFFFQKEFIAIPGLILTGFLGGFVWQPILIYTYILLLFPREAKFITQPTNWINLLVKIVPTLAFLVGFLQVYLFSGGANHFETLNNGAGGAYPTYMNWLFLSVLLTGAFTFFYFYYLYINSSYKNLFYIFTPHPEEKINPAQSLIQLMKRILPVFLLYFAVGHFHDSVSSDGVAEVTGKAVTNVATSIVSNPLSILQFFYYDYALHAPLEFLVAHVVYFGIWWVIATVFFPQVAEQIREYGGVGIILIFTASLASSIFNPQSRIGTAFMPFLFVFVILMVDKHNWNKKYLWILGGINLFVSKFWMPIGAMLEPVIQNGQQVGAQKGVGWDQFFMAFGIQMPPKWYWIYSALFAILVAWLIYERRNLFQLLNNNQENKITNKSKPQTPVPKPKKSSVSTSQEAIENTSKPPLKKRKSKPKKRRKK